MKEDKKPKARKIKKVEKTPVFVVLGTYYPRPETILGIFTDRVKALIRIREVEEEKLYDSLYIKKVTLDR